MSDEEEPNPTSHSSSSTPHNNRQEASKKDTPTSDATTTTTTAAATEEKDASIKEQERLARLCPGVRLVSDRNLEDKEVKDRDVMNGTKEDIRQSATDQEAYKTTEESNLSLGPTKKTVISQRHDTIYTLDKLQKNQGGYEPDEQDLDNNDERDKKPAAVDTQRRPGPKHMNPSPNTKQGDEATWDLEWAKIIAQRSRDDGCGYDYDDDTTSRNDTTNEESWAGSGTAAAAAASLPPLSPPSDNHSRPRRNGDVVSINDDESHSNPHDKKRVAGSVQPGAFVAAPGVRPARIASLRFSRLRRTAHPADTSGDNEEAQDEGSQAQRTSRKDLASSGLSPPQPSGPTTTPTRDEEVTTMPLEHVGLVQARAVHSEQNLLVQANAEEYVDPPEDIIVAQKWHRRRRLIGGFTGLVLVVVGVAFLWLWITLLREAERG